MRNPKCPVCNSCMSFIYVDLKRYLYCGFCKVYRAGRNDALEIVESPYKNYNVPTDVIEDPIIEESNEQKLPENGE